MNNSTPLRGGIPEGPIDEKWDRFKQESRLVSPNNKKGFSVLVVGTGLAGASAAASLAELGYRVKAFCIHDSPRRAHSIAAQGGINAAKNYPNDNDSVWRLFHDTIKGGDFRSREANVYRLAQLSTQIIDQCVAQGVPFAREYNGELANRSFGGVQVSRTFYARGQTGQQLLIGAYGALMRQVDLGQVELYPRREMLDLVVSKGRAVGIIVRHLLTGEIERFSSDAVIMATGGYGRIYFLSTNAHNSNGTAIWRCYKRGAYFANPCFTQIHPTCIPVSGHYQSKLTLMSESLRNDGRVWVPKRKEDLNKPPAEIPEIERDYFLERKYPSYGNLVPRDVASRNAKEICDEGRGVGTTGRAVYLDFRDAIQYAGRDKIREKYGNLFEMYQELTTHDPYEVPMRIYPAIHYTMGGLWVDYQLMSTIPGLFVLGEANFSDHGANRLGASALMQGLADGYFIVPYTLSDFLARNGKAVVSRDDPEFRLSEESVRSQVRLFLERSQNGKRTIMDFYRELGLLMWDHVGMARSEEGLKIAMQRLSELRDEFNSGVKIAGQGETLNKNLEFAGRIADYLELGELMMIDALHRTESCGGHFRIESQTKNGEAKRKDEDFSYVAAWEFQGLSRAPVLHKEELTFENVKLSERSYQ
jgi:succinate dehydrogenase / fumarate reductase flavoprotein subunit